MGHTVRAPGISRQRRPLLAAHFTQKDVVPIGSVHVLFLTPMRKAQSMPVVGAFLVKVRGGAIPCKVSPRRS